MQSYVELRRARAVAALLMGAALATAPPLGAQAGLGLSPMRLELPVAPGSQHSGSLTLSNESSARLRFRAELLDFFLDATGTPQFGPAYPPEAEYSCRQWLSVNPMEGELEAGTQLPVRYTLRVPPTVTERSYHCALGFTTLPTAAQMQGIGLRMAVRVVTAIYPTVGHPRIEGGIREIWLELVSSAKPPVWRAVVEFENRGWMLFRTTGELAVLDQQGSTLESYPLPSLPVLPQRRQRFLFPLERLTDQGRYTLRARADIGTGEVQEGTAVVVASAPGP